MKVGQRVWVKNQWATDWEKYLASVPEEEWNVPAQYSNRPKWVVLRVHDDGAVDVQHAHVASHPEWSFQRLDPSEVTSSQGVVNDWISEHYREMAGKNWIFTPLEK